MRGRMKKHKKNITIYLALLFFFNLNLLNACGSSGQNQQEQIPPVDIETLKSRLILKLEVDPATQARVSRGTFAVFEDRLAQKGRMIHLDVVILHATGADPKPDPIFPLAGGPGGDASRNTFGYEDSWMRKKHDIVLVSQRGTGGDNRLDCELAISDEKLQGYLDPLFTSSNFQPCLEKLKSNFDLTKYSTYMAADDLNDLRLALGYDRINLMGGSYGTRAALVYMRRHPETVRTAILNGVAPIAYKNPLFHAQSAQQAIQLLFAECANDSDYQAVFPNLEDEFWAIIDRLEKEPVDVTVTHPVTNQRVTVKLHREAFSESVRMMMYSMRTNRLLPYLIHQAFEGDYEPFAQPAMLSNRAIVRGLALGMLLCVTCAEDLDRINEEEIVELTSDTFMGDGRVRRQKAVCEFWPKSGLPNRFGDSVSVDVPVLLLSGTLDPVTTPQWGEEAAKHLPNSLHLVVPGAHGVGGTCIMSIQKQFLEKGSVKDLDISCVESMELRRFRIRKN